jgi:hypothetical protein
MSELRFDVTTDNDNPRSFDTKEEAFAYIEGASFVQAQLLVFQVRTSVYRINLSNDDLYPNWYEQREEGFVPIVLLGFTHSTDGRVLVDMRTYADNSDAYYYDGIANLKADRPTYVCFKGVWTKLEAKHE